MPPTREGRILGKGDEILNHGTAKKEDPQTSVPKELGGKRCSGSRSRAAGTHIEKKTSQDAGGDLSGHRPRDSKEEQLLQDWIAKHSQPEPEKQESRKQKLERLKQAAFGRPPVQDRAKLDKPDMASVFRAVHQVFQSKRNARGPRKSTNFASSTSSVSNDKRNMGGGNQRQEMLAPSSSSKGGSVARASGLSKVVESDKTFVKLSTIDEESETVAVVTLEKGNLDSSSLAIVGQIEKMTSPDASRDLSGRCLPDANKEERLKNLFAKQSERRLKKAQKKGQVADGPPVQKIDDKVYLEKSDVESILDFVEEAFEARENARLDCAKFVSSNPRVFINKRDVSEDQGHEMQGQSSSELESTVPTSGSSRVVEPEKTRSTRTSVVDQESKTVTEVALEVGGVDCRSRAIGGQTEETTSGYACRDRYGRRLRDVNVEQQWQRLFAKLRKSQHGQVKLTQKLERLRRATLGSPQPIDATYLDKIDLESDMKSVKKAFEARNSAPSASAMSANSDSFRSSVFNEKRNVSERDQGQEIPDPSSSGRVRVVSTSGLDELVEPEKETLDISNFNENLQAVAVETLEKADLDTSSLAIGGKIEKTSRDVSRDLPGSRLCDPNEEQRLKNRIATQKQQRELEKHKTNKEETQIADGPPLQKMDTTVYLEKSDMKSVLKAIEESFEARMSARLESIKSVSCNPLLFINKCGVSDGGLGQEKPGPSSSGLGSVAPTSGSSRVVEADKTISTNLVDQDSNAVAEVATEDWKTKPCISKRSRLVTAVRLVFPPGLDA